MAVGLPTQPHRSFTPELPWPSDSSPPARLLEATDSVTGAVSVIEYRFGADHVRVLKCDHSLLGGVWIGQERTRAARGGILTLAQQQHWHNTTLEHAQSVYVTFYLQEAIRLVNRPVAGLGETALFM
jgi:hypothetical protein